MSDRGSGMQVALETIIEWGDCDEAGIVFYPRYFYWMDCAFQKFLRLRDLSQRELRSKFGARGTPLVSAKADFRAPATYDQPLVVKAAVIEWGRSSFRLAYRGLSQDTLIFEGEETRIWAVPGVGGGIRTAPVPSEVQKMMS